MVLYVSCYTKLYEPEINGLVKTLEKFSLKYRIEEVKSLKNWNKNIRLKANYILKMLESQKDDIVWLDADARVKKDPVLFDKIEKDVDFSCFFRKRTELLSSVMFIRNNKKSKDIIKQWISLNDKKTKPMDQENLHEVIKNNKDYNMKVLPPEYCLFDLICEDDNLDPSIAVIWQRQASRRLRKIVNKES